VTFVGSYSTNMSTLETPARTSDVTSTARGVARLKPASSPTNTSGQIT
jgi:hypothetical protein